MEHMLEKLGLQNISQLFADIPESVRLNRPLILPDALSEIELERLVSSKLAKNKSAPECLNFIGGGNWVHHVPSIIDEILSRSEFYTAYTPYQPEISQGMLQGLFEYQSQICELTGMEVANSSLYDWGTALGEAGRMANRVTKRKRILVGKNVSPERIGVLRTYSYPVGIEIEQVKYDSSGRIDVSSLDSMLNEDTAALYFENPNFLGIIEDKVDEIVQKCHSKGTLVIVGVNPITLGLLRPPSSYGADIVVGDGQPLGLYPNLGGPLMGIFATREDPNLLRQMPGRLIGATRSKDGSRRGYTMVLQTREQHIRREHATSNICTNEVSVCPGRQYLPSQHGSAGNEGNWSAHRFEFQLRTQTVPGRAIRSAVFQRPVFRRSERQDKETIHRNPTKASRVQYPRRLDSWQILRRIATSIAIFFQRTSLSIGH